jgi:hypothetical protein
MSPRPRKSGLICLCLLALAVCGLTPAWAAAGGTIGYRNDTNLVILVQGSSVDPKGNINRGPPHQINPRETASDQIAVNGTKTITVYDPKVPGRVYYSGQINFLGKDQLYSIQLDPVMAAGGVPRVKLVPIALPQAMMPRKK